ncbi:MAG: chemotaxis protein CheW [Gammaproteobacteria bacterium]|nr:chemotaxis protein CheW [Gammaproteobacteria bacterium]MCW9004022.1 chemotaxis protein CheW [Gammaproteobacteria bacterium]
MAEIFNIDEVEDSEDEGLMQLVGFGVANEKFGVDILMVQEILRSAEVTAVPNSPEFVEGVLNLRGNIVPVIDLRKRLNLYDEASSQKKSWVLILNIDNRVVGFIVDHVTEVLKIEEKKIESAPDIIVSGLESQYIQGVCEIAGGLIIILDFDLVLFNEEQKVLGEIAGDELLLTESEIV